MIFVSYFCQKVTNIFLPCFLLEVFILFALAFTPKTYFILIYCIWCVRIIVKFLFLSSIICWKHYLFFNKLPWCFIRKSNDWRHRCESISGFFWVPLINLLSLTYYYVVLIIIALVKSLNQVLYVHPDLFFFFKIVLEILKSFLLSYKFWNSLSVSTKEPAEIFTWTVVNLYIWGKPKS